MNNNLLLWQNFPSHIHIGNRELQVGYFGDQTGDNYGLYISDRDEVWFDASMTPGRAVQVVIHELLHALWEEGGFDETDKEEEHVVGVLSCQLSALLKHNPLLSEWLFTHSKKGDSYVTETASNQGC